VFTTHVVYCSYVTCVQASQLCTRTRAKKVVVGLTLVAVSVGCGFYHTSYYLYRYYRPVISATYIVLYIAFFAVLPVTVLIVNVLLVREVRRASINAAANLGLHHQSTSSNSAVPTVMVIATSLVYALLLVTGSITYLILSYLTYSSLFSKFYFMLLLPVSRFVFAYNFCVYLITGKQFRSELRILFCRCFSSSSSSSSSAVARDYNDARLAGRGRAESVV